MNKPLALFLVSLACFSGMPAYSACSTATIAESTPDLRFTVDATNFVVTDNVTGLMWKMCPEGLSGASCATGTKTAYDWTNALNAADSHTFATYSDWRVPTIKELMSIVEVACSSPAINATVFPGTTSDPYWSSTPDSTDASKAWQVDFATGRTVNGGRNVPAGPPANFVVRFVRSIP